MFSWRIWLQIDQASVVQYPSATALQLSWKRIYGRVSELDFYIWNANWPMKHEAKMASTEGNLVRCTWLLISHATFYTFLRNFPLNLIKMFLQKTEMSLNILNIFRKNRTRWAVIYFHENKLPNYQETW